MISDDDRNLPDNIFMFKTYPALFEELNLLANSKALFIYRIECRSMPTSCDI